MDEIKQEEPETKTEAEVEPKEVDLINSPQAKISFKNKMMLLAIFGILLGFVIKTEAAKRVTVGFEDYKLLSAEKTYDINNLQKELERQKTIQEEQAREAEVKALEAAKSSAGVSDTSDNTTCSVGEGETCKQ